VYSPYGERGQVQALQMVRSYPELSTEFGAVACEAGACCLLATMYGTQLECPAICGQREGEVAATEILKNLEAGIALPAHCSCGTQEELDAPDQMRS
jgi:hypothetical protein